MATSLITRVKKDTFITFKSASEDIEVFNRSDKKFNFSHFALLDLPELKEASNNENVLDFQRIQSRFITGNSVAAPPAFGDSIDLSESFQNYLLNAEELLTAQESYEVDALHNTNERLFFKWLKEVGATRYKPADATDTNALVANYEEEDSNDSVVAGDLYSNVVKFIAEVELKNKNTSNKNNFEEVYIFVPSQAGQTPAVLFKTNEDGGYAPQTVFQREDPSKREFIEGYDSTSPLPPNGLELLAQYDVDVDGITYSSVNQDNPSDISIWFDYFSGEDAYLTDKTFIDPSNDEITVTHPTTLVNKTFLRSRLDGVGIDFDKNSYTAFNDGSLKSFHDYNSLSSSTSFRFNAIALYYQVEEGGVMATNLFGILFLGDVVEIAGGQSEIESQSKLKNSAVLQESGNAYGLKLNFRVDVTNNNSAPEVVVDVNDYNTFSMVLFAEAMSRMKEITDNYENVVLENVALREQNSTIMDTLINNQTSNIETLLGEIQTTLTTGTEFDGLSGLIQQNSNLLSDILLNKTSIDSSIILNPVGRRGIDAQLAGNTLTIGLASNAYDNIFNTIADVRFGNTNTVDLGLRKQMVFFSSDPVFAEDDITVLITDTNGWKFAQSITLVFSENINFNGKKVSIKTDVNAQFTTNSFGFEVATVTPRTNKIEIICSNETDYEFIVIN